MSQPILFGALGLLVGIGMSIFSYRFVLPRVLEQHETTAARRDSVFNPAVRRRIEWTYRYGAPLCWMVACTGIAVHLGDGL